MKSTSATIVRRASAAAAVSLAWAGALHVIPQIYLLRHYPEHKSVALSLLLSMGTCASIAGVMVARRQLARGASISRGGVVVAAVMCLAPLLAVVVGVRPLALYVAAYGAFRFISNWAWNRLDNALLDATGAGRAGVHATATTGFTLLGHVAGPAVFVLLAEQVALASSLVALASIWAAASVLDIAGAGPVPSRRAEVAARSAEAARWRSPRAAAFVAYTLAMSTGVAGLFSQMIFLLRDYAVVAEPKRTGGLLIALAGASSVVTVLSSSRAGRAVPTRASLAWPPLLPVIALGILAARPGPAGLALSSIVAGIGAGRYYLLSRLCASSWDGGPGRAAVLSFYNNAPNISALLAYALTGGLAWALGEGAAGYHPTLLALLAITFASAAIVAWCAPFAAAVDGTQPARDLDEGRGACGEASAE
ncbi:MAG: hypothetical protein QM820_24300 [Minicystis sp.]